MKSSMRCAKNFELCFVGQRELSSRGILMLLPLRWMDSYPTIGKDIEINEQMGHSYHDAFWAEQGDSQMSSKMA